MAARRRYLAALLVLGVPVAGCGDDDSSRSPSGEDLGGFQLLTDVPQAQALGAVWSFGPSDVWLTADGGRVLHYDGSSWEAIQLETYEMMLDIWAFGPDDIFMVGGETLAHYDGAGWVLTNLPEQNPGIESVSGIWGAAPTDLWVVGSQSTAAHYDGSSWQRFLAAGTDNTVVWGSGPDDVYVAGSFDLAHWDGAAWAELDAELFGLDGEGIWGFGPADVWIASGWGELAHFDGQSWTVSQLDFIAEASALWGSAPDDLWGVGTPGGILHYDGSWHEVAHQVIGSPYLRIFHDVHGSPHGDVWIVGSQLGEQGNTPQLYRRDPG